MKPIRKYRVMKFIENVINGKSEGVFNMDEYDEFDIEEEAIEFAYESSKWSKQTYREKLLAQIYDFNDVKELTLKRDKLQAKIRLLIEECQESVKKYEDERQALVVNYYTKLFDYKDTTIEEPH